MYATFLEENTPVFYSSGSLETMDRENYVRVAVMRYGQDYYGMLLQEIDSTSKMIVQQYKALFSSVLVQEDKIFITSTQFKNTVNF